MFFITSRFTGESKGPVFTFSPLVAEGLPVPFVYLAVRAFVFATATNIDTPIKSRLLGLVEDLSRYVSTTGSGAA